MPSLASTAPASARSARRPASAWPPHRRCAPAANSPARASAGGHRATLACPACCRRPPPRPNPSRWGKRQAVKVAQGEGVVGAQDWAVAAAAALVGGVGPVVLQVVVAVDPVAALAAPTAQLWLLTSSCPESDSSAGLRPTQRQLSASGGEVSSVPIARVSRSSISLLTARQPMPGTLWCVCSTDRRAPPSVLAPMPSTSFCRRASRRLHQHRGRTARRRCRARQRPSRNSHCRPGAAAQPPVAPGRSWRRRQAGQSRHQFGVIALVSPLITSRPGGRPGRSPA